MAKKKAAGSKGPLPVRAGTALGIVWGAVCALMAVTASFGYAESWVALLGDVYIGYGTGLVGVIAGAVYGFLDGFIAAFIVVWIYNKLNISK
ncbi:hypothetical protein GF345_06605 [Candidatus Woesearchaeota archaeon]|nr:hypothetical protein [Candidatus Woesearchaeota archaeon]